MVGKLSLQNVSDDDPLDMNRKTERSLDSPDSGLPPSPSPSGWLLPVGTEKQLESPELEDEGRGTPVLYPLSYGEGIELEPLPPKEIRYTSSVRYDSDRRFIHCVSLQPRGFGLELCRQTVLALPHSTWRHYKTQLEFQPRQRALRYQSTAIVYAKRAQTVYTTQLRYDCRRQARRFLSSVELEATENGAPQAGEGSRDALM